MRVLLSLLTAACLVLTGCAGSSTGSGGAGDGTTDTVRVAVAGGKVTPPTHRVRVTKGDTVRLVVTADVDDEVHVHGFDITKDVVAGTPATITFVADQAGIVEVELESAGLQLLQLEVR